MMEARNGLVAHACSLTRARMHSSAFTNFPMLQEKKNRRDMIGGV